MEFIENLTSWRLANLSLSDNDVKQLIPIYEAYKKNLFEIHRSRVIILLLIYIIIFFLALFGNIIFLCVLLRQRKPKTATNYFLLNLAMTDLLIAMFCIPMTVSQQVYRAWPYGMFLCKAVPYLEGICVAVSILTIMSLSVERFVMVRCPMLSRRRKGLPYSPFTLLIIWCLAAVFMIPVVVVREIHSVSIFRGDSISFCQERWTHYKDRQIYDVFLLGVLFIIPGLTMSSLYVIMGKRLWGGEAALQRRDSDVSCAERLSVQRKHVAKMSVCTAVWFAFCWLPYHILNTYVNFRWLHASTNELVMLSYALMLGHSNCAVNPVLYCFVHKRYRHSVAKILSLNRVSYCRREGTATAV